MKGRGPGDKQRKVMSGKELGFGQEFPVVIYKGVQCDCQSSRGDEWAKCLWHKHEALSLILGTHIKARHGGTCLGRVAVLQRWRKDDA